MTPGYKLANIIAIITALDILHKDFDMTSTVFFDDSP